MWTATIAGCATVIAALGAALIQRARKENNRDHAYVRTQLNELKTMLIWTDKRSEARMTEHEEKHHA
jgi:hypothetical protein